MTKSNVKNLDKNLRQINQVLEKAFFNPLHSSDWLGFHFDQPFLVGLSQNELVDVYARSALVQARLHPGQKGTPLRNLLHTEEPEKVLAHALVSLKDDRPFLFYRTMTGLLQEEWNPDDFDSMEEMLEEMLEAQVSMSHGAAQEIKDLRKEALALLDHTEPAAKIKKYLKQILESSDLTEIKNESQLRLWLSVGRGREMVPPELLPQLLIEAWASWVSMVTGVQKNEELLLLSLPELDISLEQLDGYLSPQSEENPTLSSTCPFCQGGNVIQVSQEKIEAHHRCPHLVFIGTNDPMHLLRVLILTPASIGEDTLQLLDSYYQTPGDLPLFANIVSDFYQMLVAQNRIKENAVTSTSRPDKRVYHHLTAYFSTSSQKEE